MEIARKLAGFSLGGADLLRRAMGKKIQAEMDAQKPLFIEGAKANGVSKAKADEVWNLLDKFANYGFNKSHAAAYAVVSYQTAWLKANHPVEFMAAVMNCDIHLTDKLGPYKQEVDRLGIEVVPPCVNRSGATFGVEDGRVLYALGALKNVGVDAMRLIADERRASGGRFAGLFDFAARVDLRRVGKRALEMLARAGALDALDSNRRKVFENLEALMAWSGAVHDDRASGAGQPLRRGDRRAARPAPAAARRLVAHGAAGPGACRHRLLPLRPPARRLCRRRCAASASSPTPSSLRKAAGAPVDHRPDRRHRRGARPAQVRPRHPLRLRAPLRPHRPLRGAHVLRRARRRPRPPRARHERGADRRGDARRRRAQAPRQGGAADRRRRRRRRQRRPAGLPRRAPPPPPRSPPASPPSPATSDSPPPRPGEPRPHAPRPARRGRDRACPTPTRCPRRSWARSRPSPASCTSRSSEPIRIAHTISIWNQLP